MSKKYYCFGFSGKFEKWSFLAKIYPNLVYIWLIWLEAVIAGWLKNLKVGVIETDFKQVPFVFRQTNCTYSESWGPVENFFDPPLFSANFA